MRTLSASSSDPKNTRMFIYRSGDKWSPELKEMCKMVRHATYATGLLGFFIGFIQAAAEFDEKHYHVKWLTRFTAAVSISENG